MEWKNKLELNKLLWLTIVFFLTAGLREPDVLEALCQLDAQSPPEQWERLLLATHEILKYGDCRKPCEYFK